MVSVPVRRRPCQSAIKSGSDPTLSIGQSKTFSQALESLVRPEIVERGAHDRRCHRVIVERSIEPLEGVIEVLQTSVHFGDEKRGAISRWNAGTQLIENLGRVFARSGPRVCVAQERARARKARRDGTQLGNRILPSSLRDENLGHILRRPAHGRADLLDLRELRQRIVIAAREVQRSRDAGDRPRRERRRSQLALCRCQTFGCLTSPLVNRSDPFVRPTSRGIERQRALELALAARKS